MQDKNNEKTASIQMQTSKHVPIDEVIFNREECKNELHTILENYFSCDNRFLILQSQIESIISYAESEESNKDEIITKLDLHLINLKLIIGLETFARPLFDKSHLNYLPNGKF
jgi:hypothetical protein